MKAVIYARQSSGSDDVSESVATQISNCRALAHKEGITVVGEYCDLNVSGKTYPTGADEVATLDMAFQQWFDSQTGDKMYREGFGGVMTSLKKIDYIIVDDLTRLYRPIAKSFLEGYVNQLLEASGVKIWTCKSGVIDVSQFSDGLIATLQGRINDNQIALQRQKSMDSVRRLRSQGYTVGIVARFGYRHVGKFKAEVIEAERQAVIDAFKLCNKGVPYLQIVKRVNMLCNKTTATSGWLTRMLSSPEYAGYVMSPDGHLIESKTYPAIVSLADFLLAKKRVENKTTAGRDKLAIHPLSGVVRCGYCGYRMMIVIAKEFGGTGRQHYYTCTRKDNVGEKLDCRFASIRATYPCDVVAPPSIRQWRPPATPVLPAKAERVGIVDGVMPLLVSHLVERLRDIDLSADVRQELAEAELELLKISDYEAKIGGMYSDGKISDDQFANLIGAKKVERENLAEKIITLKSRVGDKKADIEKYVAVSAYVISHRTLPDHDYKMLAINTFKHIDVFARSVKVTFLNGSAVEVERVPCRNTRAMPAWTLHHADGNYVVTYYHKSFFKGDTSQQTIYDSDGMMVVTCGVNPLPGEMRTRRGEETPADLRRKAEV